MSHIRSSIHSFKKLLGWANATREQPVVLLGHDDWWQLRIKVMQETVEIPIQFFADREFVIDDVRFVRRFP